jgi:hexosaminidase
LVAVPAYDIDIFHMCHVYPRARLTGIASVRVDIARLARNYGLANDQAKVKQYPAKTPFGELVVVEDGCQGAEVARIALTDPATTPNRRTLTAPLPSGDGVHDLCFMFTAPISGPFYAIDTVTLVRK